MRLIDLPSQLPEENISSVQFFPDGSGLVLTTSHSVWFWREGRYDCLFHHDWDNDARKFIVFARASPDGKSIAVRYTHDEHRNLEVSFYVNPSASRVVVFDVSTGRESSLREFEGRVVDYFFAEGDGAEAVIEQVSDEEGKDYVQYRPLDGKSSLARFWCPERPYPRRALRYRDGLLLEMAMNEFWRYPDFEQARSELATTAAPETGVIRRIRNWLTTSGGAVAAPLVLQADLRFNRLPTVRSEAVTPDGCCMLWGNARGRVVQWHLEERRVVRCWDWPIGAVSHLDVSPDGQIAAAVGGKGQLLLWDLE
jgi:WD40 repeat protein